MPDKKEACPYKKDKLLFLFGNHHSSCYARSPKPRGGHIEGSSVPYFLIITFFPLMMFSPAFGASSLRPCMSYMMLSVLLSSATTVSILVKSMDVFRRV